MKLKNFFISFALNLILIATVILLLLENSNLRHKNELLRDDIEGTKIFTSPQRMERKLQDATRISKKPFLFLRHDSLFIAIWSLTEKERSIYGEIRFLHVIRQTLISQSALDSLSWAIPDNPKKDSIQ